MYILMPMRKKLNEELGFSKKQLITSCCDDDENDDENDDKNDDTDDVNNYKTKWATSTNTRI